MRFFYYLCIVLLLFACESEYDNNMNIMARTAKKDIEEKIFKNNCKIAFEEFAPIGYKEVSENFVDSQKIHSLAQKVTEINQEVKGINDECRLLLEEFALNKEMFGSNHYFTKSAKDKFDKLTAESNSKLKISDEYIKEGDSIQSIINNRKNPQIFYLISIYIKAVVTENNSGKVQNMADTARFCFNKELQIVELR